MVFGVCLNEFLLFFISLNLIYFFVKLLMMVLIDGCMCVSLKKCELIVIFIMVWFI